MDLQRPEEEPLPGRKALSEAIAGATEGVRCPSRAVRAAGNWKRMPEVERVIVVRTLRPDRLTAALARFVAGTIGQQFVTSQPFSLDRSFQVILPHSPRTPEQPGSRCTGGRH